MTDCYACEKAQDRPRLKFRGPPGCVSCDARALALIYGGMEREQVEPQLRRAWPNAADFSKGRNLFWIWVRRINEAKEQA